MIVSDDLVALADPRTGEGRRDEVDRLGRRAGEDDLLGPRGVEEPLHLLAAALVGLGGAIGERVEAAVDVGVFVPVAHNPCGRAPAPASAPRRRSRDRPADSRGSAPSRIGKSARTLCEIEGHPHLRFLTGRAPTLVDRASQSSMTPSSSALQRLVLDRIDELGEEGADQHGLGFGPGNAAAHQVEQRPSRRARRRSSRGRRPRRRRRSRARACEKISASSESIRPCIISLASVFCASRSTTMRPWTTALQRPRAIDLNSGLLRGAAARRGSPRA